MLSPFWFDAAWNKIPWHEGDAWDRFVIYFILLKNLFTWDHVEKGVKSIAWEEHWGENGSRGKWETSKGHYLHNLCSSLHLKWLSHPVHVVWERQPVTRNEQHHVRVSWMSQPRGKMQHLKNGSCLQTWCKWQRWSKGELREWLFSSALQQPGDVPHEDYGWTEMIKKLTRKDSLFLTIKDLCSW